MTAHLTRSGFKMCCISSAVGGTDGDILWEDSEGKGMLDECEEEEGTVCEDGDSDNVW